MYTFILLFLFSTLKDAWLLKRNFHLLNERLELATDTEIVRSNESATFRFGKTFSPYDILKVRNSKGYLYSTASHISTKETIPMKFVL